ncbi:unnamed protein product [Amoebophrya sp. A25]|nr:unnamed protein product [Amoebophrya sp. A25]|eukprot:GSA25T00008267001.1
MPAASNVTSLLEDLQQHNEHPTSFPQLQHPSFHHQQSLRTPTSFCVGTDVNLATVYTSMRAAKALAADLQNSNAFPEQGSEPPQLAQTFRDPREDDSTSSPSEKMQGFQTASDPDARQEQKLELRKFLTKLRQPGRRVAGLEWVDELFRGIPLGNVAQDKKLQTEAASAHGTRFSFWRPADLDTSVGRADGGIGSIPTRMVPKQSTLQMENSLQRLGADATDIEQRTQRDLAAINNLQRLLSDAAQRLRGFSQVSEDATEAVREIVGWKEKKYKHSCETVTDMSLCRQLENDGYCVLNKADNTCLPWDCGKFASENECTTTTMTSGTSRSAKGDHSANGNATGTSRVHEELCEWAKADEAGFDNGVGEKLANGGKEHSADAAGAKATSGEAHTEAARAASDNVATPTQDARSYDGGKPGSSGFNEIDRHAVARSGTKPTLSTSTAFADAKTKEEAKQAGGAEVTETSAGAGGKSATAASDGGAPADEKAAEAEAPSSSSPQANMTDNHAEGDNTSAQEQETGAEAEHTRTASPDDPSAKSSQVERESGDAAGAGAGDAPKEDVVRDVDSQSAKKIIGDVEVKPRPSSPESDAQDGTGDHGEGAKVDGAADDQEPATSAHVDSQEKVYTVTDTKATTDHKVEDDKQDNQTPASSDSSASSPPKPGICQPKEETVITPAMVIRGGRGGGFIVMAERNPEVDAENEDQGLEGPFRASAGDGEEQEQRVAGESKGSPTGTGGDEAAGGGSHPVDEHGGKEGKAASDADRPHADAGTTSSKEPSSSTTSKKSKSRHEGAHRIAFKGVAKKSEEAPTSTAALMQMRVQKAELKDKKYRFPDHTDILEEIRYVNLPKNKNASGSDAAGEGGDSSNTDEASSSSTALKAALKAELEKKPSKTSNDLDDDECRGITLVPGPEGGGDRDGSGKAKGLHWERVNLDPDKVAVQMVEDKSDYADFLFSQSKFDLIVAPREDEVQCMQLVFRRPVAVEKDARGYTDEGPFTRWLLHPNPKGGSKSEKRHWNILSKYLEDFATDVTHGDTGSLSNAFVLEQGLPTVMSTGAKLYERWNALEKLKATFPKKIARLAQQFYEILPGTSHEEGAASETEKPTSSSRTEEDDISHLSGTADSYACVNAGEKHAAMEQLSHQMHALSLDLKKAEEYTYDVEIWARTATLATHRSLGLLSGIRPPSIDPNVNRA